MSLSPEVDDSEEDDLEEKSKIVNIPRSGRLSALQEIKAHWVAGRELPAELKPIAKAYIKNESVALMPKREVLKKIQEVVELYCSRKAKSWKEACEMAGRKHPWFFMMKKRHPGIIKNFEIEYYRDVEEATEQAKWDAKHKTIRKMSELAEIANDRLERTLTDDNVAPAVHVSAVKQVHDVLGVVGKRSETARVAQQWKPNEAERAILDRLVPKPIEAEDAVWEEVDGRKNLQG